MNTAAQWYAAQARIAELEKALRDLLEENTNDFTLFYPSTAIQQARAALNKETA